jgi:spore maturation protein SpmA
VGVTWSHAQCLPKFDELNSDVIRCQYSFLVNAAPIELAPSPMTIVTMSSTTSTQAATNIVDATLKAFLEGWSASLDDKKMMKELVCFIHLDFGPKRFRLDKVLK